MLFLVELDHVEVGGARDSGGRPSLHRAGHLSDSGEGPSARVGREDRVGRPGGRPDRPSSDGRGGVRRERRPNRLRPASVADGGDPDHAARFVRAAKGPRGGASRETSERRRLEGAGRRLGRRLDPLDPEVVAAGVGVADVQVVHVVAAEQARDDLLGVSSPDVVLRPRNAASRVCHHRQVVGAQGLGKAGVLGMALALLLVDVDGARKGKGLVGRGRGPG